MVNLKFGPSDDESELAYTTAEDLDTIFIPTDVRNNTVRWLKERYHFSPEQAEVAADSFLEEIYPTALGHESAHLVLGQLGAEEGLPIEQAMEGYHNLYSQEDEFPKHRNAFITAYKKALKMK